VADQVFGDAEMSCTAPDAISTCDKPFCDLFLEIKDI